MTGAPSLDWMLSWTERVLRPHMNMVADQLRQRHSQLLDDWWASTEAQAWPNDQERIGLLAQAARREAAQALARYPRAFAINAMRSIPLRTLTAMSIPIEL